MFFARIRTTCVAVVVSIGAGVAQAGGGPENALLLVDPNDADSLYVANYYKAARDIPDRNVFYMDPEASNYSNFVNFQLEAFLGTLVNRGLDDHVDYVIIPPGPDYRISASGLISDQCSSVSRFSIASIYTLAHIADEILGGLPVSTGNEYFGFNDVPRSFDSNTLWVNGNPGSTSQARQYFIGCMLGYNGERGNTIEETLSMIDRSVNADGTRPSGTFYFVETTDVNRSGPRDGFFDAAVSSITSNGGQAVHLGDGIENIVLPEGEHDCLGIMTGWASPDILGADLTILDGAFCDHLTSFAGHFGTASQTKMSDWITRGASGTCGTVEEPCNYSGKFPHPRMHVYYHQGLSLGEATFRSLGFAPFQPLMYGDPLTRPFAYLPDVSVDDAPTGEVSGIVTLTPTATTELPGGNIGHFDLHIDGVFHSSVEDGGAFMIDSTQLADGPHDVRVIAFEDSLVATQGRWVDVLDVNNADRAATISSGVTTGNLTTIFEVDVAAAGGVVEEIRLFHNGRVIAATQDSSDTFSIAADRLGAGMTPLVAVADFEDGWQAISEPLVLDIAFAGVPPNNPEGNAAPIAHSYTTTALPDTPLLLDLPATDADGDDLSITDITQPAQGSLESGGGAFLLTPDPDALGSDTVTFRASDGVLTSDFAVVTINYCAVVQIDVQPMDQTACVGASVEFEVESSGDILTYQWFFDGEPIEDATDSTLALDNLQLEDAGQYAVEVTSTCGVIQSSVESESSFLTVLMPVTFALQPQGATVCIGESIFLFASAQNATSFQWFRDGEAIPGAISPFLSIQNAGPNDRGTYVLQASNDCGEIASDPADVFVNGCGDGDGDGDNDFIDFGVFQICFTGSDVGGLPENCAFYDFDGDDDVDLDDYVEYLAVVTDPT